MNKDGVSLPQIVVSGLRSLESSSTCCLTSKGNIKVASSKHLWAYVSGNDTGVGLLRNTAMNAEITGSEPSGDSPGGRAWSNARAS